MQINQLSNVYRICILYIEWVMEYGIFVYTGTRIKKNTSQTEDQNVLYYTKNTAISQN